MTRTLVVLRHAKSDQHAGVSDRERPLNERGRRQAEEAGRWLASGGPAIDQVVVSVAQRARTTWELASGQMPTPPPVRFDEAMYTFEADGLIEVIRSLGDLRTVLLVGHNPAMQELVVRLTGEFVDMPTSCLAVIEPEDWVSPSGRLVAHGRPPQ